MGQGLSVPLTHFLLFSAGVSLVLFQFLAAADVVTGDWRREGVVEERAKEA